MAPRRKDLGELELAVLNAVWERPGSTVREIAEVMAGRRSIARTTVLTVMQRLHAKKFLKRTKVRGVFRYSATGEQTKVVSDLIGHFVQKVLGGSPAPFLAYLADAKNLTEDQIDQLRNIVEELERDEEGT
ncbi:MAG: hypothetical protein AMXMBFR82_31680 [Candidatus Hydrogenedentota bacterium]